jgi:hypothetical protein
MKTVTAYLNFDGNAQRRVNPENHLLIFRLMRLSPPATRP